MSFSVETEKENKLSFLGVEVIREQGKFTTTIYRKPTFSGVYSDFESFLPSVYKFGMVYTLVYRCVRICSNWTQFHTELIYRKGIFQKNSYPKNFIDKCFKRSLNNVHLVKENVPTVEKKRLLLVLPYLGIISLQTRTKLQQTLKVVLNCCKLEIVFKTKQGFPILPVTKTLYPKTLYLVLFISFSVVSAMSPIMVKVSDP